MCVCVCLGGKNTVRRALWQSQEPRPPCPAQPRVPACPAPPRSHLHKDARQGLERVGSVLGPHSLHARLVLGRRILVASRLQRAGRGEGGALAGQGGGFDPGSSCPGQQAGRRGGGRRARRAARRGQSGAARHQPASPAPPSGAPAAALSQAGPARGAEGRCQMGARGAGQAAQPGPGRCARSAARTQALARARARACDSL